MTKKKTEVKKEYSNEFIKVMFTEEEVKEKAHIMAGDIQTVEDLEDQLAKIKADLQGQIKQKTLSIKDLSRKVRDGFEYRTVKVRMIKDFAKKEVLFFLEDEKGVPGKKPVKTRTMYSSECQMTIDDVDTKVQTGGGE